MGSNTTYAPPPAAPPQSRPPRPRSVAGPLVLIVLGLLFLLGNLRVIPWAQLGHYYARYWPVLLILWGVIKLVEHFAAQRQGRRAGWIGVGGVFLVICLIVTGMVASGLDRVNWSQLGGNVDWDNDNFFGGMFGQEYTFTQQIEQDMPANATLHVNSDRGAVNVVTWDQNRIKVTTSKKLRAQGPDDAKKADAATQAQLTGSGTDFTLSANTRGDGGSRAVESDLEIYLPAGVAVEVATRRGDVTVRNRNAAVQVNDSRATVTLENIKGDVSLTLRRGTVNVDKVTGNVMIDGAVEEARIADVGGTLRLNGGAFDTLTLARIAKQVNYESQRTNMEFAKLDGELTLQGENLNANEITGPVRLTTRSKEIRLDDVSGPLQVENSNGTVVVHANKLPLAPIQVNNRRADVRLELPAHAAFQLDARARRGDISTDFGVSVQSGGGENRASGVVGNGGPRLQIDNDGGDVQIRKIG